MSLAVVVVLSLGSAAFFSLVDLAIRTGLAGILSVLGG